MAGEKLYEGKAKILYAGSRDDIAVTYFKDDATAFNGGKKGSIRDKGVVNANMTAMLFEVLMRHGIATHFLRKISDRELEVKKVRIIPLEVVVRNCAAGSICKRLGLAQGTVFNPPLVEFFYKDDSLGDPLITSDHMRLLALATPAEEAELKAKALEINRVLVATFQLAGIRLVDFKLEFGKTAEGAIILADEISPDTCRLWNVADGKVLDKDRFRHDMGDVEAAYQEVLKRIGTAI